MTIDEAIAFCHEKSNNIKLKADPGVFIQIAEWLEELKANKATIAEVYEQWYKRGYKNGYGKAIDDFVEACDNQFIAMYGQRYIDMRDIKEIAELLKAGGENG